MECEYCGDTRILITGKITPTTTNPEFVLSGVVGQYQYTVTGVQMQGNFKPQEIVDIQCAGCLSHYAQDKITDVQKKALSFRFEKLWETWIANQLREVPKQQTEAQKRAQKRLQRLRASRMTEL